MIWILIFILPQHILSALITNLPSLPSPIPGSVLFLIDLFSLPLSEFDFLTQFQYIFFHNNFFIVSMLCMFLSLEHNHSPRHVLQGGGYFSF